MTKKRIAFLSIAGLLFFLAVLIAKMPAEFALNQASQRSQMLDARLVTGTIWQGKAQQMTVLVNRQVINLGQVEWEISPWALLIGQFNVKLKAVNQQQIIRGDFSLSASKSISISNAELAFALPMINQMVVLPARFKGAAELTIITLEADLASSKIPRLTALDGRVLIKDLGVSVQVPVALGSFGATLSLDEKGERINADITDVDATVAITGQATFNQTSQNYGADFTLKPKPGANEAIARSLQFVAKKQADDSFTFSYNGVL